MWLGLRIVVAITKRQHQIHKWAYKIALHRQAINSLQINSPKLIKFNYNYSIKTGNNKSNHSSLNPKYKQPNLKIILVHNKWMYRYLSN